MTTRKGTFDVYNLEVAGSHNYYVSDLNVLVHNKAAWAKGFSHAWIAKDTYRVLSQKVGPEAFKAFKTTLKKGVVGPVGESGIKQLARAEGKYTHELKIKGSADRLFGYIDKNGVLVFDRIIEGGRH